MSKLRGMAQDRLKEEIKELKNGTLAAELQAKTKELTSRIEEKEQAAGRLREMCIRDSRKQGGYAACLSIWKQAA